MQVIGRKEKNGEVARQMENERKKRTYMYSLTEKEVKR